jgi:hypothetical protein
VDKKTIVGMNTNVALDSSPFLNSPLRSLLAVALIIDREI